MGMVGHGHCGPATAAGVVPFQRPGSLVRRTGKKGGRKITHALAEIGRRGRKGARTEQARGRGDRNGAGQDKSSRSLLGGRVRSIGRAGEGSTYCADTLPEVVRRLLRNAFLKGEMGVANLDGCSI